jgi:hypothetical protein
MGLLIVAKRLEIDHPEIVEMAINWLKKECNAEVLSICKGLNTQYFIEGEDIPKGKQKFDIVLNRIVPSVFSISIREY